MSGLADGEAGLPDRPAGRFAGGLEGFVQVHLRLFGAGTRSRGHIVAALARTPDIELVGSAGKVINLPIGREIAGRGNARCRTQNATGGNGKKMLHLPLPVSSRPASARIESPTRYG